jgi:hypothetical protein
MDIGEFRRRIVEYREGVVPRSATDGFLGELLEALDDDGPPVDVDDGFVILPVTRYEALREAEENLQSDRLHGFIARMNRLESEFADRIDVLVGRMDATDKAVGETLSTIFDRLGAMTSRLNRLDADVMPIRRIGPGTSPEAGQRDKDTGDRPLREIKGVADGVGSTKP